MTSQTPKRLLETLDGQCAIEGCRRPRRKRQWCATHYEYWRRHGDPIPRTSDERFWARINKTDSCWLWLGPIDHDGYGIHNADGHIRAHRYAYEALIGAIPDGLVIDHLCRVRSCVNPEHMETVTQKVNNERGDSPSALNSRKTHCSRGHEFTPGNTRVGSDGRRACRACDRETHREVRLEKNRLHG